MGIGLVRQTFDWATIERKPGVYDLTAYDGLVAALAAHHMRLLPVLLDPPKFRSSAPAKGAKAGHLPPEATTTTWPPSRAAGAPVRAHGTFWRNRPGIPKVPIHSWQIWNEPSLPAYWPTGPDPAAYTRLLQVVGLGDQAQGPEAEVVSAGIPQSRLGMPFAELPQRHVRRGGPRRVRHTRDPPVCEGRRRRGRRRPLGPRDHGCQRRPLGADLGHGGGLGQRRARQPVHCRRARPGPGIRSTLQQPGDMRSQEHLRGVVYFGWRDGAPYAPQFSDFWGLHTGLLTIHGRPSPPSDAFVRHARPAPQIDAKSFIGTSVPGTSFRCLGCGAHAPGPARTDSEIQR